MPKCSISSVKDLINHPDVWTIVQMFLSTLFEITEWPELTWVVILMHGRVQLRKVLIGSQPHGLNREVETGTPTFPLNPGVMPLHFGKIELKI